eukprot:TRINITY_DN105483_c1_g1_i1.p1 TRINITY_DN105483_c1_g1~~TRINITY_DN105483_c1_g1_i1.p1  ORF type:complete len:337 (-),score=48.87 TRINITY_DN105483_c1_g1_i1:469-1479(-)
MWYEIASLYEDQQKKSEEKTTADLMHKEKLAFHQDQNSPEIIQELAEETRTDYKNINELVVKYEKMKEYCRGLMYVKQKFQDQLDELTAAITDLRTQKEREKHAYIKEIQQYKTKNEQLLKELNVLRKKKHIALEDHKIVDTTTINTNLLVDPKEIELLSPIGQGSSSMVYKAKYKEVVVAVKKMTITEEKPQQAMVALHKFLIHQKELLNEMKVLEQVRHPNIILLLGVLVEKPNSIGIVMEYMTQQSLKALLENPGFTLIEQQKIHIALEIAQAMHYLHSCTPPIVHRDLKTSNCLVDDHLKIKLCDFGQGQVNATILEYRRLGKINKATQRRR